jgi:DNA-directed RNA polymerase subunit K
MEAPVLLEDESTDSLRIATMEFEKGVIPVTVKRDFE